MSLEVILTSCCCSSTALFRFIKFPIIFFTIPIIMWHQTKWIKKIICIFRDSQFKEPDSYIFFRYNNMDHAPYAQTWVLKVEMFKSCWSMLPWEINWIPFPLSLDQNLKMESYLHSFSWERSQIYAGFRVMYIKQSNTQLIYLFLKNKHKNILLIRLQKIRCKVILMSNVWCLAWNKGI